MRKITIILHEIRYLRIIQAELTHYTTLHDTEVFRVAVIGESESSDGLDLAKGTVH